ncbi:MAG: 3-oxoacyl-ACP reductase FabG [Thermomicrobiales bacterium]|nr:3-oxoacyl-ACP reductase FabG [Thermomicrobiales bacterium]
MSSASRPASKPLAGRSTIVTGGSRGIGQAIARRLARDGASVVVAARSVEDAERVAAEIAADGDAAMAVGCDVREVAQIERLVAATRERYGAVDIVVNNAGVSPLSAEPQEIGEAAWDDILDTNLKGAFFLSTAAAHDMIPRGSGVIINIASIAGVMPIALESAYCASKAGLIGLTKALAHDWATYGIRVHALAPGYIATEMNAGVRQTAEGLIARGDSPSTPDEAFAKTLYDGVVGRTLLGRYGTPEEIADVVAFLASDAARYMTGAVTMVDGGWTIGGG